MTKIVKQNYFNECGPCCIAFLYNKKNEDFLGIDQYDVIKNMNLSKEGFNITQMENSAKDLGILLESYNANLEEIKEFKKKYIIALVKSSENYSHYVVVKIFKNKITIFDSADESSKTLTYDEFRKIFLDIILVPKYVKAIKQDNRVKLFSLRETQFWFYFNNVLLFVFINGLNLIINLYLKYIFDKQYFHDLNKIIYFSIILSIVSFTTFIANYLCSILSLKYKTKITDTIIQKYFKNIFWKDYFNISLLNKNELLHNQNTVLSYISFNSEKKIGLINNFILLVSSLTLLIVFNKILFLISLAMVIINLCFYLLSRKIRIKRNVELKNNINKLNETLLYSTIFYDEIRFRGNVNKHLCSIKEKVSICNNNSVKSTINKENFDLITNYFNKLFFFIFVISIFYFIGSDVMSGLLFFFLQLVSYLNQSSLSIVSILQKSNEMNSEIKIIKRIENIDDLEKGLDNYSKNFILKLKNLDFSFGKNQILKNITFTFDKNTAVIGKNGIGKSTLLKLILNKGSDKIFLNNKKIKGFDITNNIHYYNNEANLLEHALYKNIHSDLTLVEIEKFIQKLDLHWVIKESKLDLEHYIQDNGKQISLGQKQIIQLFSLFYDDSRYLFLDEVLSNVKDHISIEMLSKLIEHSKNKKQIIVCISHNDKIINLFEQKLKIGE